MFITRIKGYLFFLNELNIYKTIYFNFKVFPWHTAKKLPIYFFGPVIFTSLKGKVILNVDVVSRGMVQFGCKSENIIASKEPTRISLDGDLIFNGKSKFALAIQLFVWNNGRLSFGDNSWVGSFTKIVSFRSIEIGNNFLCSWECQLFDTDFHFIENNINNTIEDTNGTVVIGNQVWLGSRVTILKNTVIPNTCIIALGSICNKNYTASCPSGSVIGGMPAKFIKDGLSYVNDKQLEKKLFTYFKVPQNFGSQVNKNQF